MPSNIKNKCNKGICIFIRMLQIGGAEKQSLILAKTLNDDYSIHFVVFNDRVIESKYLDYLHKNQIHYYLLHGRIFNKLLKFKNILKKNNVNIVFCYLASNNLWGSVVGKWVGVKWIIGGIRNAHIVKYKLIIQKWIHNHMTNFTILNSFNAQKNMIASGFDSKKCRVLHNGIDEVPPFRKMKERRTVQIITVARFVPHKDYETAIKAIDSLTKKLNAKIKIQYVIIGYGMEEEKIRRQIERLNLNHTIKVIIKPNNLSDYYKKSDIYLCCSKDEGLSNSILEAMSHSLPIIATDAGDNFVLVKDRWNGYLVKEGDVDMITARLALLTESFQSRLKMGTNSRRHVFNNFTIKQFKKKYVDFIESLDNESRDKKAIQ